MILRAEDDSALCKKLSILYLYKQLLKWNRIQVQALEVESHILQEIKSGIKYSASSY